LTKNYRGRNNTFECYFGLLSTNELLGFISLVFQLQVSKKEHCFEEFSTQKFQLLFLGVSRIFTYFISILLL